MCSRVGPFFGSSRRMRKIVDCGPPNPSRGPISTQPSSSRSSTMKSKTSHQSRASTSGSWHLSASSLIRHAIDETYSQRGNCRGGRTQISWDSLQREQDRDHTGRGKRGRIDFRPSPRQASAVGRAAGQPACLDPPKTRSCTEPPRRPGTSRQLRLGIRQDPLLARPPAAIYSWGSHCPNAVRGADPFHVVAWATEALDQVRRDAWNAARGGKGRSTEESKALKKARWALWKKPEDLTEAQQAKLNWIARTHPRVHRAWALKEGLRMVFTLARQGVKSAAKHALQRWLSWARR